MPPILSSGSRANTLQPSSTFSVSKAPWLRSSSESGRTRTPTVIWLRLRPEEVGRGCSRNSADALFRPPRPLSVLLGLAGLAGASRADEWAARLTL